MNYYELIGCRSGANKAVQQVSRRIEKKKVLTSDSLGREAK
jgi:hypothetical protein